MSVNEESKDIDCKASSMGSATQSSTNNEVDDLLQAQFAALGGDS